MNMVKNYFSGLSDKDQRALKLLVLFCGPVLVYFLVLEPGFKYYINAKDNYQKEQELLVWIEQNKSNITTVNKTQTQVLDLPLSQFISTSADKKNINISRLQPQGKKGVRVWLNDIDFSSLIDFLLSLSDKGITIGSITIDKTSTPGIVNAQCLIIEQ